MVISETLVEKQRGIKSPKRSQFDPRILIGSFKMQISREQRAAVKPAVWGVVGGAVAAIAVGFMWGGWVTGGTASQMAATSAQQAVVVAFTPACVARGQEQPEQVALLKQEARWNRDQFIIKAGWVPNVTEKYRSAVATACGTALVETTTAG
jgi:hypothetical protein